MLSALHHRPAAIEPAFDQIALADADIDAAVIAPRPDLPVTVDLQHELPVVGAREVRRALPSVERGEGLPPLLEIRPLNWRAILPHALIPDLDPRVVCVVVVAELVAIRVNRVLPRERNPTHLVDRTERIRVLRSEILLKLLVSFLFLPPTPLGRPRGHGLVV
jgi:hypothetical protein